MNRREFLAVSGTAVVGVMLMGDDQMPALARGNHIVAPTPPMGWNSWDCFGASVVEAEVKNNADYMAKNLLQYGWEYITVDIQWYEPTAISHDYHAFAKLDMDEYGRLLPAVNRFPGAANGAGFKSLSDYCHGLGLRFGIHILRGIPRQAVDAKTPVLNTSVTAADIADTTSTCLWNTDMYGVDATKPGAQQYYDSLLMLYKSWGVDFIKCDDLSRPYHKPEIEMLHSAIERISPHVVLSTSPGATPFSEAAHISTHANMWRLSDDFWDSWQHLREAFDLCAKWQGVGGPGHWPDSDMLPLGQLNLCSNNGRTPGNPSNFTKDEQITLISLWCMARSPLIFGGNLPDNDPWTLALITNRELLEINQSSSGNRELARNMNGTDVESIVWQANGKHGARYLALFNLSDSPLTITTPLDDPSKRVTELWGMSGFTTTNSQISAVVPSHGARVYKVG